MHERSQQGYVTDMKIVKEFKAPKGQYRDIVISYMLKMANHPWIAGEDFSISWKKEGDFKVDLSFKKGEVYYGIPYSQSRSSLEQFAFFVPENKCFISPTYYYEEMLGNHCSSSIGLAYQQLTNFPFKGRLFPNSLRKDTLKLVNDLKKPDGDDYYSSDVFELNGKEKVFESYSKTLAGDILCKIKKGTGHARMVHKTVTVRTATGKIDPEKSFVYCIEQTNEFDKNAENRKTTWWIDRKYSFQKLWNTFFMPVTLELFHSNKDLDDAYIAFEKKDGYYKGIDIAGGTISSNFPMTYIYVFITDHNGNVVKHVHKYKFDAMYSMEITDLYSELEPDKLPTGKYTVHVRAGIGRGGDELHCFEIHVPLK